MKKSLLVGLGVIVAGVAGLVIWKATRPKYWPAPAEAKLMVIHESNRQGSLEPCGCEVNPFGGVEREMNALKKLRADSARPVLYVDAGNLFWKAEPKDKARARYFESRANGMVDIMNRMKLDAFSPGAKDYELGVDALKRLSSEADFPFVTTNVETQPGKPLFERFAILRKGDLLVGVLSLIPKSDVSAKGLQAVDPREALARYLPEVRKKSHVVVLLSQLGTKEERKLAEQGLAPEIMVGASESFSSEAGVWLAGGKSLLLDTHNNGFLMGELKVDFKLPFKGFYSPTEIARNADAYAKVESGEADLGLKGERLAKYKANFKVMRNVSEIAGGSSYDHELVRLDKTRFGAPNEISAMLETERERVRKEALGE